MTSRKICILGDFAVGKTSLVRRFVDQAFSDKYLTTVGVKIDTRLCETEAGATKLVLWDIAGAATLGPLQENYLQGMSGYLLVCDGTRSPTLNSVNSIQEALAGSHPGLPFCVLVNKSDLEASAEVQDKDIEVMRNRGWVVMRTSAKSGEQVDQSFQYLAKQFNAANRGPNQ